LKYVTDDMPGIRRQRRGGGFAYLSPEGQVIRDPEMLERFRSLVIPPAWTDVWICPLPDGHLQVTARDARRRKVYRYHPHYRERRDESKFERMFQLRDVLWKIRQRVEHDIALDGLPRERVMATVVWLLERTLIRIGSQQLAKLNRSYGLTTMRGRHVEVDGTEIRFEFRGKSGVAHRVAVSDRRIARIIQRCQELPGEVLFQYLDDDGRRQVVDAGDVNEYLRETTGRDVTAKDFRTWAGTMLAAESLRTMGPARTKRQAEKNVVAAVDAVSAKLGNTRTVCRKYYVHPALLNAYLAGSVLPPMPPRVWRTRSARGALLRRHEREVLGFLKLHSETGRQAPDSM
jgi:DNA topoisomerase-1